MLDCNFPLIEYDKNDTPLQWGIMHGKQFKDSIQELVSIRKKLMLSKNPSLEKSLDSLAKEQADCSERFAPELFEEMKGIAQGADISLTDIVILNNYTDFRDIQLPEEGCSTVHKQIDGLSLSGQTWDMHGSAKNFVCLINIPQTKKSPAMVVFSLVGCVGMMGVNSNNCLLGVNNINTLNAKAALIWPILVRKGLYSENLDQMRKELCESPVTSGHNYIISSNQGGELWEITPEVSQCVGKVNSPEEKGIFHTNHCLGENIIPLEQKNSISSTTHDRFMHLTNKIKDINSLDNLYALLTDHEGHPKSICSHFESGAQDPSTTCGGGIAELSGNDIRFWRGCPIYDKNYVQRNFKIITNDNVSAFVEVQ